MKKSKRERKTYGEAAHYWPKDMQPFLMTATNITIERTSGMSAQSGVQIFDTIAFSIK